MSRRRRKSKQDDPAEAIRQAKRAMQDAERHLAIGEVHDRRSADAYQAAQEQADAAAPDDNASDPADQ